jgi:hypothetical protein
MHATGCPRCGAQLQIPYSGTWRCLTCAQLSTIAFDEQPTAPNTAFHVAATVLTAGLWLPVYVALLVAHGRAKRSPSPVLSGITGYAPAARRREDAHR